MEGSSQKATWLLKQVMSGVCSHAGRWCLHWSPQISRAARDGVGLFPLIWLSSAWYPRSQFPPLSSSYSPFPDQDTLAGWPHALICLSHVFTYSFGPSIINNNASFHPQLWPVWAFSNDVTLILSRLAKEVIVWGPSLPLQSAVTAQS